MRNNDMKTTPIPIAEHFTERLINSMNDFVSDI